MPNHVAICVAGAEINEMQLLNFVITQTKGALNPSKDMEVKENV